jgi:pilus assembly protein FimV
MFRKSALAMAMLGALTTGNVVALGLGEIDLKSALNQPLNAEVELLSATDAEIQELKVSMGSPRAFEQAGVDRPLFLSKLKFNVTRNEAGKPVVQITSREVIREPFLDFLMEISWSKGRLLREYTVLVDPPLTMPAAAPIVQAPAARVTPIQPAPVQSAPLASARVRDTGRTPYPVAPGEYGPTKRNDTLWQIARQVRPDAGVSIEQTMLGLLRANPGAFIGNNINNLKEGYVLRVPSRDELTAISKTEARRESRAQYQAWLAARGGSVARVGAAETPVTASGAAGQAAAVEPSLQLVAPEGTGAASATGSAEAGAAELEALKRELIMANEAMEAQRRQSEDMSGRLAVLEEQIQNMQRLIQLKDEALAQLQSQAGAEAIVVGETVAEVETPPDAAAEATAEVPATEAGADVTDTMAAADETAVAETADAMAEDAEGDTLASADEAETGVADTAAEATEEAAAEEAEPVVPAVPETATTPGFVDRLMNNPLWLGAGVAVLALLAFFGLRRKRSVETEFQESILQASGSESAAASDSEIVATAAGESSTSESSLLSEFAVSDMGSMRTDGEADPLAEADVYLAYGRFQQAEDLIADALEKDPQNEDLNLKMLEVYLAAQNQPGFDGHAELILARLENSDDPLWQKVAEMGREISPENPIYQAGGEAAGVAAEADVDLGESDTEEAGLDFDIDLSLDADKETSEDKPDSVEFTPPEETAEVAEPKLDIDMDSVEPDTIKQENTLDFDIDSLDTGSEAAEAESGDGELADMDEVSTKLDLARAYIDMGDPDGARSILDEVIEEGSDEQKDEARDIMEQIA